MDMSQAWQIDFDVASATLVRGGQHAMDVEAAGSRLAEDATATLQAALAHSPIVQAAVAGATDSFLRPGVSSAVSGFHRAHESVALALGHYAAGQAEMAQAVYQADANAPAGEGVHDAH